MFDMIWDSDLATSVAFFPQKLEINTASVSGITSDGIFELSKDVSIGYRIYRRPTHIGKVLVVHFHANAETVAHLDHERWNGLDASVISIGYRGYAWSTGSPKLTKLCSDAEACFQKLASVLDGQLKQLPIIFYGRSLGAISAIHLAHLHQSDANVKGLILESGIISFKELPMVKEFVKSMPQVAPMFPMLPDPIGSLKKIASLQLPVLIIHGSADELIPVAQAEQCYQTCPSPLKKLHIVPNGGHNDISFVMGSRYDSLLRDFMVHVTSPPLTAEGVDRLSVKELKRELAIRGADTTGCIEKDDLVALLKSTLTK
eukprot:c5718_g1_i1.p1 GENE.c5718_g1_i1~~c5718_g1_i1.p1  ORF type:complete len:331 (+),score=87.80 c5718_g1_i1:46-993(+)